jgi:hypothetical protein
LPTPKTKTKAKRQSRMTEPERAPAPEPVVKPSPETILLFLKHAALEPQWTSAEIAAALGIDPRIASQIAEELAMVGYTEAVSGKRDAWRNTSTGNAVAGVKAPRLTRKTAEELLADIGGRAEAYNLENDRAPCITKIVVFGAVNSGHDRIQDLDIGVQLEPKLGRDVADAEVQAALKALRGRAPSLKMHSIQGWPPGMGRVIWER